MSAKFAELRKLEREVKEREMAVLAKQIAEEEKKVKDLSLRFFPEVAALWLRGGYADRQNFA